MSAVTARFLLEHRKLRPGTEGRRRGFADGTKIRRPQTPPTLRDENDRAYLPASDSRAIRRRRTSSYGISCTLPESMSSTRRWISSAQACSTPSPGGDVSRLSSSVSAISARASAGRARAFFRIAEASSVTRIFYTAVSRWPSWEIACGLSNEKGITLVRPGPRRLCLLQQLSGLADELCDFEWLDQVRDVVFLQEGASVGGFYAVREGV